jgi:hypothetical protein
MICVLLLASLGFKVVVQSTKGVGVCLTPKTASSTLLRYLLQTEVGVPTTGSTILTPTKNVSIYNVQHFPPPLKGYNQPAKGRFELPPVMFVMFRDPWVRLLSGFRSKFVGKCKGNATCFKRNYIHATNPRSPHNSLVQYFHAVLATPVQKVDLHFRLQTYQCLATWLITSSVLLDIDNPYARFVLGAALNHSTETIGQFGDKAHWSKGTVYKVPGVLLLQLSAVLAPDYTALVTKLDRLSPLRNVQANATYVVNTGDNTFFVV